jgi:hypothetical protein
MYENISVLLRKSGMREREVRERERGYSLKRQEKKVNSKANSGDI